MKVYFHLNVGGFSNTYIVVNEINNEAIIIDPGRITEEIITRIEENHFKLVAVLITHNHSSHVNGLRTLRKIYNPKIYAADWGVAQNDTNVITGDGKLKIAKLDVHYMLLPGHTSDCVVWQIEDIMFTGDVLYAGTIGSTNSSYSENLLKNNIREKILSQQDRIILMPGHGPPTSLGAVREFANDFV